MACDCTTIDRHRPDLLCKLSIVLPNEKHIEESHVSRKMNNLKSSNQCEAATTGSQSTILDNKNKSKEPLNGDIIVEVGETSRSPPNKDHSSLHSVQSKFSCDGVQLYQAALKGDWKAANCIIIEQKDIINQRITSKSETVLHIAVAAKHEGFVRNLLGSLDSHDLALQNVDGNTALCFAAASGVVEIAKMLIEKNEDLPMIRGGGETTPIHMAALFGHGEMVKYLYKNTRFKEFNDDEFLNLFHAVISADIYDVALQMLENEERKKVLALWKNSNKETALHLMARKPSAVGRRKQLNLFQKFANSIFKGVFREAKMRTLAHMVVEELWSFVIKILPVEEISHFVGSSPMLLFDAAQSGNLELLLILIRSYPDLIWKVDLKNRSLFHIAAINRHEKIFNIIYELGAIKDLIAMYKEKESKNNLLHLVARLPPPKRLQVVSGAALQMQREILWYKAVKEIVPRAYNKTKNIDDQVAHDLFTIEHDNLRREGEKWMKETATACMLVATLIATVVFAAAFTLPGGNDTGDNIKTLGFPTFRKEFWFDVFILSDSVALLSSVTAIMIFLSILTSRYAEASFQTTLPTRLMLGLLALFVSIISMVLAFTATMILIRDQEPEWSLILLFCLASVTALAFVVLHFQLWFDTLRSAYLSKFLFHGRKSGLYL